MVNLLEMKDSDFDKHMDLLKEKEQEQYRFSARIEDARYNADAHRFEIVLNNGLFFSFNPDLVQEVCELSADELARFKVDYNRTDLQWREHGTGVNVLGILQGRYGTRKWMEKLHTEKGIPLGEWPDSPQAKEEYARLLGSVSSEKKAVASRENGKKGGRPRKITAKPKSKVKKPTPTSNPIQ